MLNVTRGVYFQLRANCRARTGGLRVWSAAMASSPPRRIRASRSARSSGLHSGALSRFRTRL